jgi:hypothetical protein
MHELEIYCQETVSELLDNSLETTSAIEQAQGLLQLSSSDDFYEQSMSSLWMEAAHNYYERELALAGSL